MIDLTDVHAHVLPEIDDGAKNVETSLEMLRESKRQGVETVIATSHCYAQTEQDIACFIKKRRESFEILQEAISKSGEKLPEIRLGSEVHLGVDISKFERLEELCIDKTDYILLEMPYRAWNMNLYDAIYGIMLRGMKPVMAHIERFYDHEKEFENLVDLELLYQINADSFVKQGIRRVIPYFFKNRMVQFVGSDMHNTDSRPTNIQNAYQAIEEMYGSECAEYLKKNAELLLENKMPDSALFKKKNILSRVFKSK